MCDPVFTSNGQTYERECIERWILENDTSPATGMPLPTKVSFPNIALRKAIEEWGNMNETRKEQESLSWSEWKNPEGLRDRRGQYVAHGPARARTRLEHHDGSNRVWPRSWRQVH